MDTIKFNKKNVKMVAHRGLSGIERENTYPAFVAAGNRSYFGIESDVHKTADGKFVIIHDETTRRVSLKTININVEQSSHHAVNHVVLPDLDGSFERQDIRIPTLKDYINICKKYQKISVLELKNDFSNEDVQAIINEIDECGYLEGTIFISFSLQNCLYLRELLPFAKIQWLIGDKEVDDGIIKTLIENGLDLDVYYKRVTKELVDRLHEIGIEINCWTCDKAEAGEQLAEMGVDYITSNILE